MGRRVKPKQLTFEEMAAHVQTNIEEYHKRVIANTLEPRVTNVEHVAINTRHQLQEVLKNTPVTPSVSPKNINNAEKVLNHVKYALRHLNGISFKTYYGCFVINIQWMRAMSIIVRVNGNSGTIEFTKRNGECVKDSYNNLTDLSINAAVIATYYAVR